MSEEIQENQVETVLEPLEQQTILFYGKPLIAVRLPDGSPAVVFNQLCENMGLERTAQVRRVRRKKAIAQGFYSVHIDTPGGSQVVNVLTLRVAPGWLFGIEASTIDPDKREEIEHYQTECVEVLYQWASTSRLEAPADLVPDKPIEKPVMPDQGASRELWRAYYRQMADFLDWQISVEEWRGTVENRLSSLEAFIPNILERLPDPTITLAHQNMVKYYVAQLAKVTDKPYATIYSALYTVFSVPRYQELREDQWEQVEQWFKKHLGNARGGQQPEQGKLL